LICEGDLHRNQLISSDYIYNARCHLTLSTLSSVYVLLKKSNAYNNLDIHSYALTDSAIQKRERT